MHRVLQAAGDFRRAAAGEDRLNLPQFGAQSVVQRTDQQRPFVLIADHRRRVAPGVIADHAIDHLGEELRQDALVVDAVGQRDDDRPIAQFLAHLARDRLQAVVLHCQHDNVDVADLAGPIDHGNAHDAARLLRGRELVGRDPLLAQCGLRRAVAHNPYRRITLRHPGRNRRADGAGANEQNIRLGHGRPLNLSPTARAGSLFSA